MTGRSLASGTINLSLLAMIFLGITQVTATQLDLSLPSIAYPRDKINEDWSSPLLSSSNLRPAQSFVRYPVERYMMELPQLQWRWGDPINIFVLKPKGFQKPPEVLIFYGSVSGGQSKGKSWQEAITQEGFVGAALVSGLIEQQYHRRLNGEAWRGRQLRRPQWQLATKLVSRPVGVSSVAGRW